MESRVIIPMFWMWTVAESRETCQEWERSETGPQEHCPAPPGRWKNFLLPLPFKCNSVCPSPPHPPSSLAGSSADIQPSWEKAGSFSLLLAWLKSPELGRIEFSSLSASLSWIPPHTARMLRVVNCCPVGRDEDRIWLWGTVWMVCISAFEDTPYGRTFSSLLGHASASPECWAHLPYLQDRGQQPVMPGCEGWTGPRQSLVDISAEGPGVMDPHRLVVSLAVGLKKPLLNFVQNKDLV